MPLPLIPVALGLGGLGIAAAIGGDRVGDSIEAAAEGTGDVAVAVVAGTYSATKAAIKRNTTEVFMAITVMALAWGAVQYAGAVLTRR